MRSSRPGSPTQPAVRSFLVLLVATGCGSLIELEDSYEVAQGGGAGPSGAAGAGAGQAGQGGAGQHGLAGAGAGSSGASGIVAGQGGAGQGGAGQAGQAGAGSGGSLQAGAGQGGQGGAGTGGAGTSGAGQAGSSQAGAGQAGAGQGGAGQGGAGQGGSPQAGAGQGGTEQAGAGQAGSAQAGGGQAGTGGAGQGGAGGPTCAGAEFLCGDACVTESAAHCGGCEPCPVDEHGEVSCEAGACLNSCAPGFAFAAGRCRDFGGWYLIHNEITGPAVDVGNELNGGKAACPNGFNKIELGGLPLPDPQFLEGPKDPRISMCVPKDIVGDPTKFKGDFGGVYLATSSGGCKWGNPYRSDKLCGCPGGFDAQELDVHETASTRYTLGVCRKGDPLSGSFGGLFAKFIDETVKDGALNANCFLPHMSTNQCKCPLGQVGVSMQSRSLGSKNGGPLALHTIAFVACVPGSL